MMHTRDHRTDAIGSGFFRPFRPPSGSVTRIRDTVRRELSDTWAIPREEMPVAPLAASTGAFLGLQRAARDLTRLLVRVVVTGNGDLNGRGHRIGRDPGDLPPWLADRFLDEHLGAAVARPDVVIGPGGPQFLEFNVAAAAGGAVELHCWLRTWNLLYRRSRQSTFVSADPVSARSRTR